MGVSVCLSVRSNVSKSTRNFLYVLAVAVARSSFSDKNAIRYELPVLWIRERRHARSTGIWQ